MSTSALADAQSNVDAQSNEANEVHEVAPSGDPAAQAALEDQPDKA